MDWCVCFWKCGPCGRYQQATGLEVSVQFDPLRPLATPLQQSPEQDTRKNLLPSVYAYMYFYVCKRRKDNAPNHVNC
jgi:hypothetical protein